MTRFPKLLLLAIAALTLTACQDVPTDTTPELRPLFAKPPSCGEAVPLAITINDGIAGAGLTSDGQGAYVDGPVGAHLNGPTGNLMLWTSQYGSSTRYVTVAWSNPVGGYQTTDRVYTNSHTNDSGNNACGFKGMSPGTSGTAALEVELDDFAIVRYGKACDGTLEPVADRPITSRLTSGTTWTIAGDGGRVCQRQGNGRNAQWVQIGDAGPFELTLVAQ